MTWPEWRQQLNLAASWPCLTELAKIKNDFKMSDYGTSCDKTEGLKQA